MYISTLSTYVVNMYIVGTTHAHTHGPMYLYSNLSLPKQSAGTFSKDRIDKIDNLMSDADNHLPGAENTLHARLILCHP